MQEQWKQHPIYNLYLVSTTGKVYSTISNRLLKQQDNHGYKQVVVHECGKVAETKGVHKLVAETFIPNPLALATINHKDNNPANNNVTNLEWMKHGDNVRYSQAYTVVQFDLAGNILSRYKGTKEAAFSIGIPNGDSNICACCNGKRRTAYKYIWRYE